MDDKDIGHTGSGRVRLRRGGTSSGPSGAVLEIMVSERPYRDASPGVEYPKAVAHTVLDLRDLAVLHLLMGRRLEELVADPDRRAKLAQDSEYLYRPPPVRESIATQDRGEGDG